MPTQLIDLDTGRVWALSANTKNFSGDSPTGPTYRYSVNCRASADVRLGRPWISKHHAQVHFAEGKWWIVDGGSVNTVTVNGERVPGRRTLQSGDVLGLGKSRLRFETDGGAPSEQ